MKEKIKWTVRDTMHKLGIGDHITDEELKATIRVLPQALEVLEAINRREYYLVTNDLRQELFRLESYLESRKSNH